LGEGGEEVDADAVTVHHGAMNDLAHYTIETGHLRAVPRGGCLPTPRTAQRGAAPVVRGGARPIPPLESARAEEGSVSPVDLALIMIAPCAVKRQQRVATSAPRP
jgi:hypothetical protein